MLRVVFEKTTPAKRLQDVVQGDRLLDHLLLAMLCHENVLVSSPAPDVTNDVVRW